MSKEQANSFWNTEEATIDSKYDKCGITFVGEIVSLGQPRDWKEQDSEKVLGKSASLGLTDGKTIYNYTLKVRTGDPLPAIGKGLFIEVKNCSIQSKMGQHRVVGDFSKVVA